MFRYTTRWIILLAMVLALPAMAQTTRPARMPSGKNSTAVRHTFEPVIERAAESTVQIIGNDKQNKSESLGTIVSADGYIVTKASEIRGDLTVTLRNREKYAAKLVGIVDAVDLAMLKIDATDLKPVEWADATQVDDGMWVASPGMGEDPVAVGMISLPGRRKVSLMTAYIGVRLEQMENGAKIVQVMQDSGAQKAGLQSGDLIVGINSASTPKREDITGIIGDLAVGTIVKLKIQREGKEEVVEVTLTPRPERTDARAQRSRNMNQMGTKLSARRAGFPAVIQHDSTLSATTCGGPLVTLDGKVIGMNIARSGRVESFALPSDVVQSYLEDLKEGKYAPTTQPTTEPTTQP